ncbi:MAG TPA: HAD hydrolase-like protein, partial [Desulfohalobiaceae bacterium]|nr:HAD hydrolase-like protein [Desulfohalobiaceae bacterium]
IKPDPDLSIFFLTNLQSSPDKTLFVGDTEVDILTAINGDMIPAGVLWGYRGRKELKKAGASFLFENPSDLIAFIDK